MSNKEDLLNKKFQVLDHGYVILRDVMGSDQEIVNAARISYGDGTKKTSDDLGLIDYLMRHRHTSPFEMAVLKFQIKLPIFVERQWVRHRTCSMNEMSGRYSVMPEEYYVPEPEAVRQQSKSNKQGREEQLSADTISGFLNQCSENGQEAFKAYRTYLGEGVTRELARINLPLSTYTEKVWQMNLHNLLHFIKLRADKHAQWEIRQYAETIEKIVAELFPYTYKSWVENVRDAITFSKWEWEYLAKEIQYGTKYDRIYELLDWQRLGKGKRAIEELRAKIKQMEEFTKLE